MGRRKPTLSAIGWADPHQTPTSRHQALANARAGRGASSKGGEPLLPGGLPEQRGAKSPGVAVQRPTNGVAPPPRVLGLEALCRAITAHKQRSGIFPWILLAFWLLF